MTERAILRRQHFADLFLALHAEGFAVVGPTVRDGAIVYDELASPEALPIGWTEVQDAGRYRLERRQDQALFGYSLGPHSWKKYFHAPRIRLFKAHREGGEVRVEPERETPRRLALLGVRACELAAIAIQDKVLLGSGAVDPHYAARREDAFFVAVNCGQAGGTCFCVSMETGPRAKAGFDLALTELTGERHEFLVEVGTERGAAVLARVRHKPATGEQVRRADACVAETAKHMGRALDTSKIKELLARNLENDRWEDVAKRCLACANCTMVCPTCFCSTVEDVSDLTGDNAERWRRWDSCFNLDFSYLHGGSVRSTIKSRYRQWLTHKLGTWIDQFGSSGCVGCGRCITWCPVGIDLTEEVRAIRASEEKASP
jgi:formate hydrogenlyase subunit 6/NADH:ubiquinone oxidoreductase subunit I